MCINTYIGPNVETSHDRSTSTFSTRMLKETLSLHTQQSDQDNVILINSRYITRAPKSTN